MIPPVAQIDILTPSRCETETQVKTADGGGNKLKTRGTYGVCPIYMKLGSWEVSWLLFLGPCTVNGVAVGEVLVGVIRRISERWWECRGLESGGFGGIMGCTLCGSPVGLSGGDLEVPGGVGGWSALRY